MTTKELENKLKISKNTCIHCPTEKLAKQVLEIFHQLGLKWCNEKHYIICTNWDKHEENTLYYPFDGLYSSLKFANLTGYKIISAEEFITLHTEKEEIDLENYEPKRQLKGFPKEIIARMLDCQEEQGNPRDVSVFEKQIDARQCNKGFDWGVTQEGWNFWTGVINNESFNVFFEKYPKQDNQYNSQEFRVGDKVIDIIYGEIGVIKYINLDAAYSIHVSFSNNTSDEYLINGVCRLYYKTPQLLHYRDDYDYSAIDFNNLPKRQEANRWRAKIEETYYSLSSNFTIELHYENNNSFNDEDYDSGNYFQTKEEVQELVDKLKEYFKQLINK